jgi:NAD kinase
VRRLTENKLILIVRRTRLDSLRTHYNTMEQARFCVEHLGVDFTDYIREDNRYKEAAAVAEMAMRTLGCVQVLEREFLANFIFGERDIIVVLGQDGLVANTLKYLDNQLVIGVNPDPDRWDGILLPFHVCDLSRILQEVFKGRNKTSTVTMAEAELSDGQSLYAVNDFYVGAKTHVSARYNIDVAGRTENQSSSGIIISTGLGSTGWLRSVLAGATGIAGVLGNEDLSIGTDSFAWDAECLYYAVREPFPSKVTGTSIVFGRITKPSPMRIESQMASSGVIFSDGIESDFLEFNSGAKASITVADKCGRLAV